MAGKFLKSCSEKRAHHMNFRVIMARVYRYQALRSAIISCRDAVGRGRLGWKDLFPFKKLRGSNQKRKSNIGPNRVTAMVFIGNARTWQRNKKEMRKTTPVEHDDIIMQYGLSQIWLALSNKSNDLIDFAEFQIEQWDFSSEWLKINSHRLYLTSRPVRRLAMMFVLAVSGI